MQLLASGADGSWRQEQTDQCPMLHGSIGMQLNQPQCGHSGQPPLQGAMALTSRFAGSRSIMSQSVLKCCGLAHRGVWSCGLVVPYIDRFETTAGPQHMIGQALTARHLIGQCSAGTTAQPAAAHSVASRLQTTDMYTRIYTPIMSELQNTVS